jgi:hypothetical protein
MSSTHLRQGFCECPRDLLGRPAIDRFVDLGRQMRRVLGAEQNDSCTRQLLPHRIKGAARLQADAKDIVSGISGMHDA